MLEILQRAVVHVTSDNMNVGRNCTKSVLKLLAAKNSLSISVMCIAVLL